MPDSWPRHHLRLLLTAVMFYTRVPCPRWVGHEAEQLNRATVYFPLIGWLVGGVTAGVYWGAALLWPLLVAVLTTLRMVVGMQLAPGGVSGRRGR